MLKSIKYWIRNVLGFSKTEANGFPLLVIVVALFLFAPFFLKWAFRGTYTAGAEDKLLLDSLAKNLIDYSHYSRADKSNSVSESNFKSFEFNPNTATLDTFLLLGIKKEVGQRIINYRNAGGTYEIKSDLQKIYGFSAVRYEELYEFIQLPELLAVEQPRNEHKLAESKKDDNLSRRSAKVDFATFDINQADTTLLMSIYGIGPVLSARIVKYRSILGGFVEKEQLTEVYGIQEDVLNRLSQKIFIEENFIPERINVNVDSIKTIASHPYISYGIAKAIYNYRLQHGRYTSSNDLLKVHLLDSINLRRIKPYLAL